MRSAAALRAAATAACVPFARRRTRVKQCCHILLQAAQLAGSVRQLVRDRERSHHGEPGVADLAEGGAQAVDPLIEILGETLQVILLAVLAGHTELTAVDRNGDLGHGTLDWT